MRDYSFGNFISALRVRRGLSQYQLGALVHVSDKAVSKWENGASKPRMNTMVKLAEVLDVSVDELLTGQLATSGEKRKDLSAMEKAIIKKAENRMEELYGAHPPFAITNRFQTEKMMLKGREMLLWMGFLGSLREKFYENHGFFAVRGAQMGASFLAWLLGGTNVNPLPAHYYCPVCKKVEWIPDVKCGLDAPDQSCSCGAMYEKDGFGIDAVHMYPMAGGSEILVSRGMMGLVKSCFEEYFEGYGNVRQVERAEEKPGKRIQVAHYTCDGLARLTVVEDSEETLSFQDFDQVSWTTDLIRAYAKAAAVEGCFEHPFGGSNLAPVITSLREPKFSDLFAISGLLHGTGLWKENGEVLYKRGIPLDELITNREDVYAYLYQKLNGKSCDHPSGQVYEIKEYVQMGRYFRGQVPLKEEQMLLECGVPEWYVESMKKALYVFPKTHLITYLKKDICEYSKEKKV